MRRAPERAEAATVAAAAKGARAAPAGGRVSARNFYGRALDRAERLDLAEAERVEGLDDEIALMRVRLKRAVEKHPEDVQLLVKGLDILVRAVGARYRLSPKSRKDLAENLAAALNSLGDQLLPPEG